MNLKYLWIPLIVSLPFWWGVNVFQKDLEDFFFWKLTEEDFEAFSAAVSPPVRLNVPIRDKTEPNLSPEVLSARAVFVLSSLADGGHKILFQKNPDQPMPIASLAKLMTAYVATESYNPGDDITVSKEAVAKEEDFGQLKAGETLRVGDLLWILLMESSNDAAWALAEKMGVDNFVNQMNAEAMKLGMANSKFSNPAGVDPDSPEEPITKSTAQDLATFALHLLEQKPFLWKILGTQETDLYVRGGDFHHTLRSTTNGFISSIPRFVGAKTGFTPLAKQCLILVQENPRGNGYIIYVLLGSNDRFGEMKKLVEWTNTAWRW